MEIDGVSQSTGDDLVVEVGADELGVLLVVRDRGGVGERGRVVAAADPLAAVLADRPAGPQVLPGQQPGGERSLHIEVRRNEVLLTVGGADAAVGLDDLMDAVAAASPA